MTIPNAENNKKNGIGPDIWLAGDPEDLKDWMDKGVKGIVTNTVVLKDMTDKYGSIIDLTKRYLDITCLLNTSQSQRDDTLSRKPSSA